MVGWSRQMLYSGFNILPRSVIRSANSIDRSDNLDVMSLKTMTKNNNLPDKLAPPMQNAPGAFIFNPQGTSPFYRFVTVQHSGPDCVDIWSSVPYLQPVEVEGETYVENTIQTYGVQIPYTERIDGQLFTRFRTEHRTRTVPVTRFRKQLEESTDAHVEQTYTVSVPYTEFVGGVSVTRSRLETRTRLASQNEIPHTLASKPESNTHKFNALRFFDTRGVTLAADELLTNVGICFQAIQIAEVDHVVPYFEKLLNPETKFVIIDYSSDNAT